MRAANGQTRRRGVVPALILRVGLRRSRSRPNTHEPFPGRLRGELSGSGGEPGQHIKAAGFTPRTPAEAGRPEERGSPAPVPAARGGGTGPGTGLGVRSDAARRRQTTTTRHSRQK
ncbi:hypothetical protein FRACA_10113 [Frankia canadensis]|uniref:Uncharacterized protein n=1 Tax=Frankia canadensis TaxID=1836972 RepID=A0A2I2KI68_9ACTN|nr:hypothetical protein FRACA_10113 [Frankia canadensis]SOU52644.1 hypothetical protein FRACA_10113 [Frankia canadensis]